MKKITFIIILAIAICTNAKAQCEQNSTFALSFSWGQYKSGCVISIEGYSWGIDRNTFFGAGVSAYEQDAIWIHPETKVENPYKKTVADFNVIGGIKMSGGGRGEEATKFYTTISGSASVKGNLGVNLGLYYQPGDLILIGLQPGYQTINGAGISFKTIFRF